MSSEDSCDSCHCHFTCATSQSKTIQNQIYQYIPFDVFKLVKLRLNLPTTIKVFITRTRLCYRVLLQYYSTIFSLSYVSKTYCFFYAKNTYLLKRFPCFPKHRSPFIGLQTNPWNQPIKNLNSHDK